MPNCKNFQSEQAMLHLIGRKNKRWVLKAVSRKSGRTIAWVIGGHAAQTFKRLYDLVKHLTDWQFYTDYWETFSKVLPAD